MRRMKAFAELSQSSTPLRLKLRKSGSHQPIRLQDRLPRQHRHTAYMACTSTNQIAVFDTKIGRTLPYCSFLIWLFSSRELTIKKQLRPSYFIRNSSFTTTPKGIELDQAYVGLLDEPATYYLHSSMPLLSGYKQAAAMTQGLSTPSTPAWYR